MKSHSRSRWLKAALLAVLPIALLWKIASIASWRPRVLAAPLETTTFGKTTTSGSRDIITHDMVVSVAFSPDGQTLATGHELTVRIYSSTGKSQGAYAAGQVRLWDVSRGRLIKSLPFSFDKGGNESNGVVRRVVFSQDGKWLMAANDYNAIGILQLATGRWIHQYKVADDYPRSINYCRPIGFSHDNNFALYAEWKHLASQDVSSPKHWERFKDQEIQVAVALVDLRTGKVAKRLMLALRGEWPQRLMMTPDGRSIACATKQGDENSIMGDNAKILFFDVQTGKRQRVLILNESDTNDFALSPDGQRVATCAQGGSVTDFLARLHTPSTNQTLRYEGNSDDHASLVRFSPDGQLLAVSTWNGSVQLWDGHTFRFVRTLDSRARGVNDLAFSPDGRSLAGNGGSGTIRLWRVK